MLPETEFQRKYGEVGYAVDTHALALVLFLEAAHRTKVWRCWAVYIDGKVGMEEE